MAKRLVAEEGLKVRAALEVVDLAKSSYYYTARKRSPRALDGKLINAIEAVLDANRGVYGYRKVARALQAGGLRVNHKRVLRHLRAMGRLQKRKRKGIAWTRPSVVHPESSNTYWEMDTTTVWCGVDARRYLCGIIDAYDRGIPGSCFSDRCRADEAIATLEAALAQRFGGRVPENHTLILRVDRGSQFVARRFRQAAAALGVTLEYAGIQCPDDKPFIESFFGKYKTEEVYRMDYGSAIDGSTAWELYRRWYETERIHQSLGYRTPEQVVMSRNHHLSPALPCPV
jgi:putative transposase